MTDERLDGREVGAGAASARLGREVQVTIRPPSWLDEGSGTFHRTITSRPLVPVALRHDDPQP